MEMYIKPFSYENYCRQSAIKLIWYGHLSIFMNNLVQKSDSFPQSGPPSLRPLSRPPHRIFIVIFIAPPPPPLNNNFHYLVFTDSCF